MKKSFLLIFATFGIIFLINIAVQASSPFDIKFPIAELANCADEAQCRAYCDSPANQNACIAFAKSHGLIETEDVEKAEKLVALGPEFVGPGGCRSESECRTYCDSIDRIEECLAFAEEHDLLDEDELEEARKVSLLKSQGIQTPGACNSKDACEAYCEDPDNILACVEFAEKAGFISSQEAAMVRRTGGVGPGGCVGKDACEEFCEDPDNFESCIDFVAQNGLMSDEEYQEAQKVKQAVKQGKKVPGNCRSKECAEEHCSNPKNIEECADFAVAAGFMTKKEAQIMRKHGKLEGPGGCRGEGECRLYCEDSNHGEECIRFAVDAGFMDPKDAEKVLKLMQRGKFAGPGGCQGQEECQAYCEDQNNIEECINFAAENGFMEPEEVEKAKKFMLSGQAGPGGCKGFECKDYCESGDHIEECMQFAIDNGMMDSEQAEDALRFAREGGPGGCRGRECETYCSDPSHGEECILFAVEIGAMSQEEADQILEFMKVEGPGGPGGFGPGGEGSGFGPGGPHGDFGPPGGFQGPGGCSSPSECQTFCTNPENFDECFGGSQDDFGPHRTPRLPQEFPSDFEGFEEEDEFSGEFPHDEFGPGEEFKGEFDRQFQQEFQRQFEEQSGQQFKDQQRQFQPEISPDQLHNLQQLQQQLQQGIPSPEQLQQLQQLQQFQQFPAPPPSSFPSSGGGGVLGIFQSILNFLTGR